MEIDEGIVNFSKVKSISSSFFCPNLDAVDYSAVSGDSNVYTLHYASAGLPLWLITKNSSS